MTLESEKIRIGEEAPDFCLPRGDTGDEVCLKNYRGGKLLVVFLRGSW